MLGSIFGLMSLLTGIMAGSGKNMMPAFAACIITWVLVYLWLFSLRLVVSADSLSYTSLFRGRRTFKFSEIKRVSVECGIRECSDRFKPFVRLVVAPTDRLEDPIYANLKVFSRRDLQLLFGALRDAFNRIDRPDVVRGL